MGKFFNDIKVPFVEGWKFISPPYAFAWETLFSLSVFSCLMAALSTGIVKFGISLSGFVFLILGTAWLLIEKPIRLFGLNPAPWITGGLISFLCFGSWFLISPFWLIVSLPVSAALVSAISEFISPDLNLKSTDPKGYQRIIITTLSYLIISCWIAFGFTLYQWFDRYPSLTAIGQFNNVSRSNFVVRINLSSFFPPPEVKAIDLLNRAELVVKNAIHERSWGSVVQPWANLVSQNPLIVQDGLGTIKTNTPPSPEDALWQVDAKIARQTQGYTLYLIAIWRGPSADPAGYYLTKTCQIVQTQQTLPSPATGNPDNETRPPEPPQLGPTIGQVTCDKISSPILRSSTTPPA